MTFLFLSCENKPQQIQPKVDKVKHNEDSIARVKAEAKKARIAFEDSVAIYAWGDAKFGMTPKEVLQTKAFHGATKFNFGIAMSSENERAIKESLCLISSFSIWAHFGGEKNNELTEIEISGSNSWQSFKTLTHDLQWLIAKFKVKYGQPKNVFTDLETLEYMDLDRKKHMLIADWVLGSGKTINGRKFIEISMETYSETSYEYKIIIRNSAFPKNPKTKTKEELDKEKAKERKTKEIIENSF